MRWAHATLGFNESMDNTGVDGRFITVHLQVLGDSLRKSLNLGQKPYFQVLIQLTYNGDDPHNT